MNEQQENYFYTHLAAFARNETVIAAADVQDTEGRRLVRKGSPIPANQITRLAHQSLQKPLVTCVSVDNAITAPAINTHVQKAVAVTPNIARLLQAVQPYYKTAIQCLGRIALPPPLPTLLAVMARRVPAQYTHALDVAVINVCLGVWLKLGIEELGHLATIGVLHDIGNLFINPVLLDRDHKLSWAEWHQIYQHPLLSSAVLQDIADVPAVIGMAIAEHHERLDGSGYPHSLKGPLNQLGGITAVAEVVASVSRHESNEYLETVLKANAGKLDAGLLDFLAKSLIGTHTGQEIAEMPKPADLRRMAKAIRAALTAWHTLDPAVHRHAMLTHVATSMAQAETLLWRVGIDLLGDDDSVFDLIDVQRDGADALREILFQLRQILHDVNRHRLDYRAVEPKAVSAAFGHWVGTVEADLTDL